MGVLLQEELDVFDAGRAVSVDILHFLDLDGDRLGLLALAIALVVLTERELCAGDGGAVVAGGDELLQAELVEVGGEVLEEVALEGVVAVAVDDLAAEGVGVELEVGLDLFLDVDVLGVELVLLGRLRGVPDFDSSTCFPWRNWLPWVSLTSFRANYGLYSTLYKTPIWYLIQPNGCITPYICWYYTSAPFERTGSLHFPIPLNIKSGGFERGDLFFSCKR